MSSSRRLFFIVGLCIILIIAAARYALTRSYGPSEPTLITLAESGTILNESDETANGINILTSWTDSDGCVAFENSGKVVGHFPGIFCSFVDGVGMVSATDETLTFYGLDFLPIWQKSANFIHHEVTVASERKEIFFLDRTFHKDVRPGMTVCSDAVVGVDFSGKEIFRWDTRDEKEQLDRAHGRVSRLNVNEDDRQCDKEFSHLNSIAVLPEGFEDRGAAFKAGNLLISSLLTSAIFIVDRETRQIVWYHHEWEPSGTHSARWTTDGNIVFFKNNDHLNRKQPVRVFSEIILLNPVNEEVLWSYRATTPNNFMSSSFGHVQPLANGHFLVTDNPLGGRAFEITRDKRIVWEWVSPQRSEKNERPEIYKVIRVPRSLIM